MVKATKAIVISDIHINDYRNYNIEPFFRLKQFSKILDIFNHHKDYVLIITGDYFHQASPRPYIFHEGVKFFEKAKELFEEVFIIHGQHDCDSRTSITPDDTFLSIFGDSYLEDKTIEIAGKSCYFFGWKDNYDFSKIDHDYVFSHIPFFFKVNPYELFQYKFKYLIAGDIHKSLWIKENQVIEEFSKISETPSILIPGSILQHSFNDDFNNYFYEIDFLTDTITRKNIHDYSYNFLRLTKDKNIYELNKEKFKYLIYQEKEEIKEIIQEETKVSNHLNLLDFIKENLNKNYLEIHEEILKEIKLNQLPKSQESFYLERIKIENFRSIELFELNIEKGHSYLFHGNSGAGKSSIFLALYYALTGDTPYKNLKVESLTKHNKKNFNIEVVFKDKNNIEYKIIRKKNTWNLFINEEEIKRENKNELKKTIQEYLPFVKYLDLLMRHQENIRLFSSISNTERLNLINDIFNLNYFEEINLIIKNKLYEVNKTLQVKQSLLNENNSQLEEIKNKIPDFLENKNYNKNIIREFFYLGINDNLYELKIKYLNNKKIFENPCYYDLLNFSRISKNNKCVVCGKEVKDLPKPEITIDEYNKLKKFFELKKNYKEEFNLYLEIIENNYDSDILESKKIYQEISDNILVKINSINLEIKNFEELKANYNNYLLNLKQLNKLFLEAIAKNLSNEEFTISEDLSMIYLYNREYPILSGGEKIYCDIYFLTGLLKLLEINTFLVFDETFSEVSYDKLDKIFELLEKLNFNNLFIISHDKDFPYFSKIIGISGV